MVELVTTRKAGIGQEKILHSVVIKITHKNAARVRPRLFRIVEPVVLQFTDIDAAIGRHILHQEVLRP